jgi:outer membrane receptor for ferrienterochelin and colicin
MAARLNKLHQEDVRLKIKTSQLINVLQDHALTGGGEFASSRMKAIEILLRKSIPDLSAVTIAGDAENPLNLGVTVTFVKPNGRAA